MVVSTIREREMKSILLTVIITFAFNALASEYAKVDADLATYDSKIKSMKHEFLKTPTNPYDKEWVLKKLAFMVEIDQTTRFFTQIIFEHNYSQEEVKYFNLKFSTHFREIDSQNTYDLKKLLKIYHWFTISEFGAVADNHAWLLVQHADLEPSFQKEILLILEKLLHLQDTKPTNYAYLFDRVAASWSNESERKLQRYGTQGKCIGPGIWEALPSEEPEKLDQRRARVGLGTMEEYKLAFKDICN